MGGWISLHRKMLTNPILTFGKSYSRAEAWIWLLLRANYEEKKVVIGADLYKCKKGQMITSQLKLCKTFNWGNSRLKTFLKLLQKDEMIKVQVSTKLTLITILNYESYQNSNFQTKTKQRATNLTSNTSNKSNKGNNIIKTFMSWWTLYNKKVGKKETLAYWLKNIKETEHIKILKHTTQYVKNNEKQYRKDPVRYLKRKTWEDELVENTNIDISKYKLDAMGKFYIAYCSKCNVSEFYTKEGVSQESRCCKSTLTAKRGNLK